MHGETMKLETSSFPLSLLPRLNIYINNHTEIWQNINSLVVRNITFTNINHNEWQY